MMILKVKQDIMCPNFPHWRKVLSMVSFSDGQLKKQGSPGFCSAGQCLKPAQLVSKLRILTGRAGVTE